MKWALTATMAIAALAVGMIAPGALGHQAAAAATGTAAAEWNPAAGMPLVEPVQIQPAPDGVVSVTLVANAAQSISVAGAGLGSVTPFTAGLESVAGTPPPSLDGPTLHVRPGGRIELRFLNYMNQPTNIHYHGLHVAPNGKSDNIFRTFAAAVGDVPSDNMSIVDVPLNQPAGTYWYHVHNVGSARQLMTGLSGLLIIDPTQAAGQPPQTNLLPAQWQNVLTRQLELRDVQSAGDSIAPKVNSIIKFSTRLLDAQYEPRFTMHSNRWELWRLANVGANVYYDVGLSDGSPPIVNKDGSRIFKLQHGMFHIVGEDGLPVWKTRVATTLLMPPGKRFDVLVHISKPGAGFRLLSLPYAQQASKNATTGAITPQVIPLTKTTAQPTTDVLGEITVQHVAGPLTPAVSVPADVIHRTDPNGDGGFGGGPADSQNFALLPDRAIAAHRTSTSSSIRTSTA